MPNTDSDPVVDSADSADRLVEDLSPTGSWVPIADAARQLGLSRDGVLKRVRRGRVVGRQQNGGRWYVRLSQTKQDNDASAPPPATPADPTLSLYQDRVRELNEEVLFLRGQAAAYQRQAEQDAVERGELRRLLGNTQQQLTMLLRAPAPAESSAEQEDEADEASAAASPTTHRPWWQFWKGTTKGNPVTERS